MIKIVISHSGLFKEFKSQLLYLGASKNLSKIYNFGFMLGFCLGNQIVSGLILAILYMRGRDLTFRELFLIIENTINGSLIRYVHIIGVSFFFICIYIHIGRGLYYGRFTKKNVWIRGVTILLLLMATAFIGYVLPNNQISFWGASVITSLITEVPYLGKDLVELVWGSVSVCKLTLLRFFTLHFILPFVLLIFVLLHIIFLHSEGSSNPLGTKPIKRIFRNVQLYSDFIFILILIYFIFLIIFIRTDLFGDDENFVKANLVETPVHIQPEWYFLFAYAVLRSIPNKLGGVIGLVISIFILYFLSLKIFNLYNSFIYKSVSKVLYWTFIVNFFWLSWIGACRVEYPYVEITQFFRVVYFIYFFNYFLY